MTRRGSIRRFDGVSMRLSGEDSRLNDALNDMEYVAGVIVTGRRDLENMPDNGVLFLQCRAHSRSIVEALAQKHGLQVV